MYQLLLHALLWSLIVGTTAGFYWFWIRPILRINPSFKEFYEESDTRIEALRRKFAGLKQKLTTAFFFLIGIIVSGYDFFLTMAQASGYGLNDLSTLTDKVPPAAWPLIGMAVLALIQYLRNLNDARTNAEIVVAAATGEVKETTIEAVAAKSPEVLAEQVGIITPVSAVTGERV